MQSCVWLIPRVKWQCGHQTWDQSPLSQCLLIPLHLLRPLQHLDAENIWPLLEKTLSLKSLTSGILSKVWIHSSPLHQPPLSHFQTPLSWPSVLATKCKFGKMRSPQTNRRRPIWSTVSLWTTSVRRWAACVSSPIRTCWASGTTWATRQSWCQVRARRPSTPSRRTPTRRLASGRRPRCTTCWRSCSRSRSRCRWTRSAR